MRRAESFASCGGRRRTRRCRRSTLLNDPVYIEAAQALARRMVTEGGGDAAVA